MTEPDERSTPESTTAANRTVWPLRYNRRSRASPTPGEVPPTSTNAAVAYCCLHTRPEKSQGRVSRSKLHQER